MGAARSAVRIGNSLTGSDALKKTSSTRRTIEKVPAHSLGNSKLNSTAGPFSINTPRQVRVRLGAANSSGKRRAAARKADGALPQELSAQQMPNSPSTANRKTGRTAMGPWSGPFESAMSEEPPSPTLYLDRAGSAHFSLEGFTPAAHKAPGSPRFHQPSARPQELPLAVPGGLDYIPPALRRAELKDHAREVALAASKGEPKGSAAMRSPRFSTRAKRHAGHQVFQPSGRFY